MSDLVCEGRCIFVAAMSKMPREDQFAVAFNRRERPRITERIIIKILLGFGFIILAPT